MTNFAHAMRAEWLKARSIRSTWTSLAALFMSVAGVGLAVVTALGEAETQQADYDPSVTLFYGLNFGHVAAIVFAVLVTAGEYNHRTIHTSLLAVPDRRTLLAAKLCTGGLMVLASAALAVPFTLVSGRVILGESAVPLDAAMIRSCAAAALYPCLLAMSCMSVAMILRDQTAALGTLIPFFFLISPLLELVPVVQNAAVFLPDRAGQAAIRLHPRYSDSFGPLTGIAILAIWVALAATVASWTLRNRDA